MTVDLNGLGFETVEGTWSSKYIEEPSGLYDSDRVTYYIKFRRVDPNESENGATFERRLRLVTYHSQSAYDGYEEKLKEAIRLWLDSVEETSPEEVEAAYVFPSIMLRSVVI